MLQAWLLSICACFIAFSSLEASLPSPKYLLINDDEDGSQLTNRHFDFGTGYTNITLFDYHVKITAEMRTSDKKLLVIVFPQEQGVSFKINTLQVGKAPRYNLQGAIARVTGVFKACVNMNGPVEREMMVPVQISPVNEFSVDENEALIQGNQFMQKILPETDAENMQ